MREITGRTGVFCVLGHPVGHTLSPVMHQAALAALGEDAIYLAFDVAPEALPAALAGLAALGVRGANLTIPHKEAALQLVDDVSPEAALIGAINTVKFEANHRLGRNTDAPGFLWALREAGFALGGPASGVPACGPRRAVLLGAGGSARAVAVALAGQGARLAIANRTPERAASLARRLCERFGEGAARAVPLEGASLARDLEGADLLVNTTSVGMAPRAKGAGCPIPQAPLLVPEEALSPPLFVFDLVYNPAETRLLAAARRRGCRVSNGLSMLAYQGALALEFWLGRPAPAERMRQRLAEALYDADSPADGEEGCSQCGVEN